MKPDAEFLLRLYPRSWRARYGEEFLAILGGGKLSLQQVNDVASGAVDAWLSSDVRRATGIPGLATNEGGWTMLKAMIACERKHSRATRRDALLGAGVMIGTAVLLLGLGIIARRSGWTLTAEILVNISFLVSLMVSLPFWLMKGQPWKAQASIVGGTTALLVVIGWLASIS
jgi:hypothetical protein